MPSLVRTLGPSLWPVTLDEVYAQTRAADRGADTLALLDRLIRLATETAETITRRALLTQTWRLRLDEFPAETEILLPRPPLQSVTSIQYVDSLGATQTFASSEYAVDTASDPGRIYLDLDATWPTTRGQYNDVTITYVAGWTSAAAVPQSIRHAILMLIAYWYDYPTEIITGTIVNRIPWSAETLLMMERAWGLEP